MNLVNLDESRLIYQNLNINSLLYLVSYGAIYNRNRYLISLKSGITYVIYHTFSKFKVDSYDYLPLEKNIGIT